MNKNQKALFAKLEIFKKINAYLAGGTALALQIGHRYSVDFDLYTPKEFDPSIFERSLLRTLPQFATSRKTYGTLTGDCNSVHLSCFYYDYPLIKPLVRTKHVDMASVEDIAAMKIIVISQRGKRRDFLDVYVLAKKFGLDEIINWTRKKYKNIDHYIILKGLTYFKGAEGDASERGSDLLEPVKWEKVRSFITAEAARIARKVI